MTTPPPDVDLRYVIEQYPSNYRPEQVECLGSAGGFSGACFWRLTTRQGRLCLRRWPPGHPNPAQLQMIHDVLARVYEGGLRVVPVPLRTSGGMTFVPHAGQLWELSEWLPGEADYERRPGREKLIDAAETLARFHLAAAEASPANRESRPSPGLLQRYEQLTQLQQRDSRSIRLAASSSGWPGLHAKAVALLDLFDQLAPRGAVTVEAACRAPVPLQPCIRDIWHDHVLFVGEKVSGIVDFGAMRLESVVGDVTRLLGSLVGDDAAGWQTALAAYESIRPLSDVERSLIGAFDQSAVLLSGMNWLKWICIERRQFEGQERILARLDVTIRRLRHLNAKLYRCPAGEPR